MAQKYPKRVMQGNPSVEKMRKRLVKQRESEAAAKSKAAPATAGAVSEDGGGGWTELMGLRGVPVVSVSVNEERREGRRRGF